MTQLARFTIRPRRSRLYYTVRVFTSKRAMQRYAHRHRSRGLGARFSGLASTWVKQRRVRGVWRATAHAGEMLLVRGHCGAEVVSHECTHLALAWARRVRVRITESTSGVHVSASEERFCYVLGQLVNRTYRELWRRRLIT